MPRNAGGALTHTMREQYEELRRRRQRELAERVLALIGVQRVRGRSVVTTADMKSKERELLGLLGEVRAWFTAVERQRLYKNNAHLGASVARLVLSAVGHPLERLPGGGGFTVN